MERATYVDAMSVTACTGCEQVVTYRFERTGAHRATMTIDVFHSRAPAGSRDGDVACTTVYDVIEAPPRGVGLAPSTRVILQESPISDTCGQGFTLQALQVVERAAGGAPTLVANWAAREPDEAFPGWIADGGSRNGWPLVPCPDSALVAGRKYCDPGCTIGGANPAKECTYPPVPDVASVPRAADFSCADLGRGYNTRIALDAADRAAGRYRSLLLVLPADYDPGKKYPVVWSFHGGGGAPADELGSDGLGVVAHRGEAIVVAPSAVDPGALPVWDDLGGDAPSNRDLALFDGIEACLEQTFSIDADRVSAIGMSGGAFFAAYLGMVRADRLAAFATFSGGLRPMWVAPGSGPAALVTWGGATDRRLAALGDGGVGLVSFADASTALVSDLRGNGQIAVACDHGGGHKIPAEGPGYAWHFLSAHVRGQPSPFAAALDPAFPGYCNLAP